VPLPAPPLWGVALVRRIKLAQHLDAAVLGVMAHVAQLAQAAHRVGKRGQFFPRFGGKKEPKKLGILVWREANNGSIRDLAGQSHNHRICM